MGYEVRYDSHRDPKNPVFDEMVEIAMILRARPFSNPQDCEVRVWRNAHRPDIQEWRAEARSLGFRGSWITGSSPEEAVRALRATIPDTELVTLRQRRQKTLKALDRVIAAIGKVPGARWNHDLELIRRKMLFGEMSERITWDFRGHSWRCGEERVLGRVTLVMGLWTSETTPRCFLEPEVSRDLPMSPERVREYAAFLTLISQVADTVLRQLTPLY